MKKKILIVEDNETSLLLLNSYLSKQGFEVHACKSVDQASELLSANTYDMHLVDLMLQGELSGEVLISAGIQPAIVISALYFDQKDLETVKYVRKPYKLDELLHMINTLMK